MPETTDPMASHPVYADITEDGRLRSVTIEFNNPDDDDDDEAAA